MTRTFESNEYMVSSEINKFLMYLQIDFSEYANIL